METKSFTKRFDGKKYHYMFNGKHFRNLKENYKYGCYAIWRDKDMSEAVCMGNNKETTLRCLSHLYSNFAELFVVEIQDVTINP